jgi:hypothetical protein
VKAAIVVLSDPAGGEDSVGRVFNALASASDFRNRGHEVTVLFQGAGTRWPHFLVDPSHPAHGLFEHVHDLVAGASDACSTVFGAREGVASAGLKFVTGNPVDGAGELPSLATLAEDGFSVLTF